jgi:ankyrin repeat protein
MINLKSCFKSQVVKSCFKSQVVLPVGTGPSTEHLPRKSSRTSWSKHILEKGNRTYVSWSEQDSVKNDNNALDKSSETRTKRSSTKNYNFLFFLHSLLAFKLFLYDRMEWAAQNGSIEEAKRLLQKNGKVALHKRNDRGRAPLFSAVEKGHTALVALFLEKGADANAVDDHGETPLLCSVKHGRIGIATLLLQNKANVNAVQGNGWGSSRKTPLHYAWNIDMMRLLVNNGADLTLKDASGQTPLYVAAERARIEKATFLLECGADIEAEDNYGSTPLFAAIHNVDTYSYQRNKNDEQEMVRLLLQNGANVDVDDSHGCTPLHCAESVYVMKLLVDNGADVHAKTVHGGTPLHWAAEYTRSIEIATFLLECGADIDAKDDSGDTPLHKVVSRQENQLEVARMLLNSHANQFIKNKDGDLPVHLACRKSQHDLIAVLAENCSGALGVFDKNGWLPLHLACMENAPLETVYTLLRHDPLASYLRQHIGLDEEEEEDEDDDEED